MIGLDEGYEVIEQSMYILYGQGRTWKRMKCSDGNI